MKICDYCFERIKGGAYIQRERKYHFCSEACLSKWEKEKKDEKRWKGGDNGEQSN